jgi:hypothetical protein
MRKFCCNSEAGKLIHCARFRLLNLLSFVSMRVTVLSALSGGACYSDCTV